jgi:hypothetical protein
MWQIDRRGDLSRLDSICHNSRGLVDPDGSAAPRAAG